MPSRIWTRCAGSSEIRALAARPFRLVEAQHLTSTRRLVDSAEEQVALEALIDRAKPPLPVEAELKGLHFLLTTSFRYPPLAHGSRFATRFERSLWYGSDSRETAFAEAAYYRLLFLEGTAADLGRLSVEISAYRVPVRTRRGVELARYAESQALGAAMREAGVEAFRFPSARDPERGTNVALFTPRAFAAKRPTGLETWICTASRERVEFQRKDFFARGVKAFERATFLVDGALPAPAP